MRIRHTQLQDTHAISALFRTRIPNWQRIGADGRAQDVAYTALSMYERWLHGGAWMADETAAIWLNHLHSVGVIPLSAWESDTLLAYVELYPSHEPEPFGRHLHLGQFITTPDAPATLTDMLMQHIRQQAKPFGRLTAACTSHDTDKQTFYTRYGFTRLTSTQQYLISAQTGQGFYKSSDNPAPSAEQIATWAMPIGRTESAHQHWETLWPRLFPSVPELLQTHPHCLRFNVGGQEALVCFKTQLYDARSAEIFCWTPKGLSPALMIALRDWAYKQGYRTLYLTVSDKDKRLLGPEPEAAPYHHQIYAVTV